MNKSHTKQFFTFMEILNFVFLFINATIIFNIFIYIILVFNIL
jgi:hypothetical protein